uniref:Putative secreted peptide n=1 Tax=Anopheles braziliensis TaxID=58242 RepID=A0A2M3ZQG3_9DIPT
MPYSIIFAMHVYVVCVLLSACPCGSLPASLSLSALFCVFARVYPCPKSSSTSSSSTAATPHHCPSFLPNLALVWSQH